MPTWAANLEKWPKWVTHNVFSARNWLRQNAGKYEITKLVVRALRKNGKFNKCKAWKKVAAALDRQDIEIGEAPLCSRTGVNYYTILIAMAIGFTPDSPKPPFEKRKKNQDIIIADENGIVVR